jgi:hypothetical protein
MSTRRNLLRMIAATSVAAMGDISQSPSQTISDQTLDPSDWELSPDGHLFEERYVCFSKGLVHGLDGLPDREDYSNLCNAIQTRELNTLEGVRASQPLINAAVPWVDPTAGKKLNKAQVLGRHAEPWFNSNIMLGDIAELYWASLCRDIPFEAYGENETVGRAKNELEQIDAWRFSTPLFRGQLPAAGRGGYLSQFLIKGVPLSAAESLQKLLCPASSSDFLTTFDDWINCQDGARTRVATTYLKEPRHIFNGRMLSEFVRSDFSFQAYLSAGLILQSWGRGVLNPGLAQRYTRNSEAFVNNGWPQILALVAQASEMALQDAWFWKWRVFRRLRPEELAGRSALLGDDAFNPGSSRSRRDCRCRRDNSKSFHGSSVCGSIAYTSI